MPIVEHLFEEMRSTCAMAWQRGLLSGFNGNISLRMGEICCVTRAGAAKAALGMEDVVLVEMPGGAVLEGARPSSELGMHLAIYARCPEARAIVHCHPRHMLALEMRVTPENFLRLPLFEADMLRQRLGFTPALAPGTQELAMVVAEAAVSHEAVWLARHGLACHGGQLKTALALAEELDHLAAVQLLAF